MRHEIGRKSRIPARLGPKSVSPPSAVRRVTGVLPLQYKAKGAFVYICDFLKKTIYSKAGPVFRTTGELSWPESSYSKAGPVFRTTGELSWPHP